MLQGGALHDEVLAHTHELQDQRVHLGHVLRPISLQPFLVRPQPEL